MPTDRYDESEFDLSSRRSIDILWPPTKALAGQNAVIVQYFYHRGQYWLASVPLDCVANVYGQAFNFSRPKTRKTPEGPETIYDETGMPKRSLSSVNHLQCRFVLCDQSAVKLYPLDTVPVNDAAITEDDASHLDELEPTHRVTDLVYSIEAVGPPGITFGFWSGLRGQLLCTHRFISTEEMVFERIAVESQYVTESPALPITNDEVNELFRKAILRSDQAGLNERYYLYRVCGTNNCTSNPFQILDRTVKYSFWNWLGSLLYRIPFNPRFYLRIRGLDADPSYRRMLRDEFAEFVAAPETRKRRREYVRQKIKQKRALQAPSE